MKWLTLVLCLHILQATFAQSKSKFRSQNFVGVVGGESDAAIQVQSINGVQRGTWFTGLGVGLDNYYHRTVPLFLSVSKYLSSRPSAVFFSVDGGVNFIWDKSTAARINSFRDDGDFGPSLYYGLHAGYKIGHQNKKVALLMTFGYTAKRMQERFETSVPCPGGPCGEYDEKIDYRLNRYSFKLGWMF